MLRPWEFVNPPCRELGTEAFYPDLYDSKSYTPAALKVLRETCGRCEYQNDCLIWALKHEGHGVWAGTTDLERRSLRKSLKINFESLEFKLA